MMKIGSRILALGVGALLIPALAGCANPVEAMIKGAIEDQTGVKVDQDGDSFTVETEEGTAEFSAGTEVPDTFPAGVPLPQADPSGAATYPDMWALTYEGFTRGQVDELIEQVRAAGYTESSLMQSESFVQGAYVKDEMNSTILWSEQDAKPALIYGVTIVEP